MSSTDKTKDFENQRKKEGLFWVNERNKQLRYSSNSDQPINYLQPLEVYKTGEEIKRGQALSIAVSEDKTAIRARLGESYDPTDTYVVITNPEYHTKTLGLALEPAHVGKEVHIQNTGTFRFYTDANEKYDFTPVFTNEDIGQNIYVIQNDFTSSKQEAWKGFKNIISLGILTDLPMEGTTQKEITLSLNIEGDNRGLLDSTQFEMSAGEQFIVPLESPVKVIAIGESETTLVKGSIYYNATTTNALLEGRYIGFQRADGSSAFINFNSDALPSTSVSNGYFEQDAAFVRTAKYNADQNDKTILIENVAYQNYSNTLQDAFDDALEQSLNNILTELGCTNILLTMTETDSGWCKLDFQADSIPSPLEIRASSNCLVQGYLDTQGSTSNQGKGILADLRYNYRQNVLGLYFSSVYNKEILIDDKFIVIKNGIFILPKETTYKFIPGETYYLGFSGNIVTEKDMPTYLESVIRIGHALDTTRLALDIGDSRKYNPGSLPIGYIKPSVENKAEYGFMLCDGVTELKVDEYPELFSRLQQYFSDEQLNVQS